MKKLIRYSTISMFSILVLISCKKKDQVEPVPTLYAYAGPDQNVLVGQTTYLNGYGSWDVENNPFEYEWNFLEIPQGSAAELVNINQADPSFVADISGRYVVELRVFHTSESLDTVVVGAFTVTDIAGSYEPLLPGPDVGIRVFRTVCDTLYATCEFSEIGGITALKIAGFDGDTWFPLDCGLEEGSIYDMIDYDCQLYVTGQFDEIGCIAADNIARWDGKEWHEVNGGLTGGENPFGYALEVFEGLLYVGGQFEMAGNVNVSNMAKWDGEKWLAAGNFEEGSVREMEIYKNDLYAGGYFERINGMPAEGFAIFDGSGWSHPGNMGNLVLQSTGWVRDMEVYDDLLFISGEFSMNNEDISELITWNGSTFSDFGRTFSLYQNYIYDLKTINDILYIGGSFQNIAGSQSNNVIEWNGQDWGRLENGVIGTVLTIEEFRNHIYIGGDFNSAGGIPVENMVIWEED